MDWDDLPKPDSSEIVVGENLERASIAELEARVAALQKEIARVEQEIERKRRIGADAASVFKD